ncbi:hypothetical protein ASPWEDRAFT_49663 [Aspergillus wentii DTO 134E9]|uniref:HD/PDEase domain-containing protein n=1 Tax=Aspergillus wentii DTO 134E9 TaxID=1073089 RepID=A0A1L9RXY7_ASPWE|nr:uncharacterized protein ASPWEDRAFT_49663 [Aspergillus wentii DTO 134E9]KAI9931552.1 hypothetical protein MW887_010129 [Aspergillus wentii]OJJ39779.1 hypothetical protein ASPWEDRAFT_49663 [Aspergillus wentii DTO 134E9]
MSSNTDPQQLFASMSTFVTACMANHDPSHNPAHVHRVVSLARRILQAEQLLSSTSYDPTTVNLAALLHDIGDRKYVTHVAEAAGGNDDALDPKKMVKHALLAHGADEGLAEKVQTIVSHVSYTTECADPAKVKELIAGGYPELAIVQDADRLDAIGAVGIGRCFTFLGAQGQKFVAKGAAWEMGNSIEHFGDKLERLEGMMKTQTGWKMAKVRTERLREFRSWWEEEVSLASTYDIQQ